MIFVLKTITIPCIRASDAIKKVRTTQVKL